jgi:hypothetical protein
MRTTTETTTTAARETATAASASSEGHFSDRKKLSSLYMERYATAGLILTGRMGE